MALSLVSIPIPPPHGYTAAVMVGRSPWMPCLCCCIVVASVAASPAGMLLTMAIRPTWHVGGMVNALMLLHLMAHVSATKHQSRNVPVR